MREHYPIKRGAARNEGVRAEPLPWRHRLLIIICAVILAAGFFLAARQHFMSMELGIKNSNLRKQLKDLETEKRRLMLAREVAYSPDEVKRLAIKIGFREIAGDDPVVFDAAITSNVPDSSRPDIVKTVSARPVESKTAAGPENSTVGSKVPVSVTADTRPRRVQPRNEKTAAASNATAAVFLKLR